MTPLSWYRLLLHAYPPAFRARFGRDLEELFSDLYRTDAAPKRWARRLPFWRAVVADAVRQGAAERLASRRRRLPLGAHRAHQPPAAFRFADDVAHALRALRQQRGVSAVIVATLALAIGANSAIFTVVYGVLLRPLPFAEPERVVSVRSIDRNGRESTVSLPDFEDWRRGTTALTGLSLMGSQTANLTGSGEPDRLRAGFVSADFFSMLGVTPFVGRTFAPGDDGRGARKTAVLDYDVWQTRFGGDPAMIGRTLILNNEPHDVIGVLPPRFEFPIAENDVWLPFTSLPSQDRQRGSRNWLVFARLAPGVTSEAADAELKQIAGALAQAYPDSNEHWSAGFTPIHEASVLFVGRNLRLLMGAAVFVLLVACANIANLLLSRASRREREIAVRAALGASRGRIVCQLLIESLALATTGGVLGLLLSAALTDGILALLPTLPRGASIGPNMVIVTFTGAMSVTTGIVFGLVPALRLAQFNLRDSLGEGARTSETRTAQRFRGALVVAELALSLMLLTGAGLFVQSVVRLTNVDLGYDPQNLLTLEYRLPRNKYPTAGEQLEFHQRVIDRVERVPGVVSAAISGSVPQSGNGSSLGFWRAGESEPPRDRMPRAQTNVVTSRFFETLGIPVLQGRTCSTDDRASASSGLSILVNRHLADRFWPNQNTLGQRLRSRDFPGEAVVVGVVGDTRPNLLSQPVAPQIYACLTQAPGIFATVAVKTIGDPMAYARSVQQAIWSVDADQPMWKIRSADTMIGNSVQRDRFVMLLMSFAAGLALLLAALGTYSVLSDTVQRRAREVGIRMALGATPGNIVHLVLMQTAFVSTIGIVLGLAGALALSDLLTTQLYDISPRDPFTILATAATLAFVALLAAWVPTRRATSVDPMITLRAQ